MPKVRITKTTPIAEDGIHVRKYSAGWEGEVSEAAAALLVSCGAATVMMETNIMRRTAPTNEPPVPSEGIEPQGPSEKKEDPEPAVMRIWQLSEETGVSSAKLLQIAKRINVSVTGPMSGLSNEEINKIKSELEKPKR